MSDNYVEDAICNLLLKLRDDNKLKQVDVKDITELIRERLNDVRKVEKRIE